MLVIRKITLFQNHVGTQGKVAHNSGCENHLELSFVYQYLWYGLSKHFLVCGVVLASRGLHRGWNLPSGRMSAQFKFLAAADAQLPPRQPQSVLYYSYSLFLLC